jgi:hypothetical protein
MITHDELFLTVQTTDLFEMLIADNNITTVINRVMPLTTEFQFSIIFSSISSVEVNGRKGVPSGFLKRSHVPAWPK